MKQAVLTRKRNVAPEKVETGISIKRKKGAPPKAQEKTSHLKKEEVPEKVKSEVPGKQWTDVL